MSSSVSTASPAQQTIAQPSLRTSFSWTLLGNLIYTASQWGILTVLAKLGSPELVGLFVLGFAITAPVVGFTDMLLRNVQATDARREFLFWDYLGVRAISTTLALAIIVGLALGLGFRPEVSLVIIMVGVAKAIESFSDLLYGYFQKHEQMNLIAISMILKGPLSLLALALVVYLTASVVWGALALALVWALLLLLYDVPNCLRLLRLDQAEALAGPGVAWPQRREAMARLAQTALPLGFVMLLNALNTNIPRYFVDGYMGEYQLGIFAGLAYILVGGKTVILALGHAASPRLSQYFAAGERRAYLGLLLKLILIGGLFGSAAILVAALGGSLLLSLLYSSEYGPYTQAFVWMMIAAAANYIASFLVDGMTAARYFKAQTPLFGLVTIILLLTSTWLIPTYGLVGGALALLCAGLVQIVGSILIIGYALRHMPEPGAADTAGPADSPEPSAAGGR